MSKHTLRGTLTSLNLSTTGQSYSAIFKYFLPEFITALILYSLPYFVDCYFIAHLKSTDIYTISGVVDNVLNLFVKIAEGLSIGTVAIAGYYNGLQKHKDVGRSFVDALWVSVFIGGMISFMLYVGGYWVYKFFNFTDAAIQLGLPFLKVRAVSMFLMFIFFACIGFFRSIKNSFIPMILFFIGSAVFIFFDYCLIFGQFGFPELGLQGSAVSYLLQYIIMLACALSSIFYFSFHKKYEINILAGVSSSANVLKLLAISLPIVIDKAIMAFAYIWLSKVLSCMGQYALANFAVIKLMERMAFLPAVAFSQVITFLVSNDIGFQKWADIRANIAKVLILASSMVAVLLFIGSMYPAEIIQIIDRNKEFGGLAQAVFPALSVLVFFDLLQLILSGALRGACDVQTVMLTRLSVICFYFVPVSYLLSRLTIASDPLKFFLIYGSFFIGNALMSVMYIKRFAKRQ
ncbi:MATE family efflux transporter [Candidatus Babeliales bacterium]|nr:MATE family efflux transporter [Candidatus Babeliales bacterium]MBP9843539.1 MATE family efflux transporter [Candidatus Babeliales bacterium]